MSNNKPWQEVKNWGRWGKDDERGILNETTPQHVLNAISLIKQGKVFDLETPRFKGIPAHPAHASFDLLSYASPTGRRNMARTDLSPVSNWNGKGGWLEHNEYGVAANTEILIGPLHLGTHIDALNHMSFGADDHFYNGYTEKEYWTNFGAMKCDTLTIQPIILRGVLLDVPGALGKPHLDPNHRITVEDIKRSEEFGKVELKEGDVVLTRTGDRWPQCDLVGNAGLSLEACRYLVEEKGAFLLGNDTTSFEYISAKGETSVPGHQNPVHEYLLTNMGVHIIELLMLNELAEAKAYEFCFVCAPSKFKGATGMFTRPIAIV
ncbi:MAG: cyclase family protein [Lacrimispora sp.]|uniref:cyclase family protein n=1 Tax=Lacrimispora sp. TaxID=2719234 RepID=UPI0039E50E09